MSHIRLDKVEDLIGFAAENAKGLGLVKILTRATLTSDDPDFYHYSEQFSNSFLNKNNILVDGVYKFLVIIHKDLSADLYVNDFAVSIEIKAKRDIKAGESITQNDIADIRKVKFPDIKINETDKVIYCFKVGWHFGLFFELTARSKTDSTMREMVTEKLDTNKMMLSIGALYRYLSFYHVYKVLELTTQFEDMMRDGWFPFIEILAKEYKDLSAVY